MKEMSSLEVKFQVKMLKKLKDSKIQKIKEIPHAFLFELYSPGKRLNLVVSRKFFFVTEKNYDAIASSNFCVFLKSKLIGQRIIDIRQIEFDRIIEIETEDYILIIELFGEGNIILTNQPEKKIIHALNMRSWKDREIKKDVIYQPPPSSKNPFKTSLIELKQILDEKELVRILAKDLGFGGEVAREICQKLSLNPESKYALSAEPIYEFLQSIEKNFSEMDKTNEFIEKEYEVDYNIYRQKDLTEVLEKGNRIRKKQIQALNELNEKKQKLEQDVQKIMEEYIEFEREFNENKKKPLKEVSIKGITFNPRISFNDNIQNFYKKIKDLKNKIQSLNEILNKVEYKTKKEKKVEQKKEWYEKFRWFISSDGFVVIGGKDAETNEIIIRKHLKKDDLVFHTDITGSPFVIIKNPDAKRIPATTIRESAEFCACFSKAWKIGIQADVYYILPEQVKKEGGLPKGSFMIFGKREWIRRIELLLAIGVYNEKIIYGPISAVSKKTKRYIVITTGEDNIKDDFNKYFGELAEEAKKVIPYGKCKIVETHGN
ncbi:MAG: NFACT family protein [Candidatus Aenigmatarchaeota archaeon]